MTRLITFPGIPAVGIRIRPLVLLVLSAVGTGCAGDDSGGVGSRETNGTAETSPQPAVSVDERSFQPEEGFTLLTLDEFDVFYGKPPASSPTWTSDGDSIRCTGTPRGYIYTKSIHANFTLRFDYRFEPTGAEPDQSNANTGCLVYVTGEHKLWPVSLEVQGKHAEMAAIKANGRSDVLAVDAVIDDEAARQRARRPVGEWNSVEIVSRDGSLVSFLNGERICENRPGELTSGFLGFQSEDFPVDFRNIRIRSE